MLERLIELKKSNTIFIDLPIKNLKKIKDLKSTSFDCNCEGNCDCDCWDCNCDCRTACDCSDCNDCICDCDCNCDCDCDCSVDCNCDDDTSW